MKNKILLFVVTIIIISGIVIFFLLGRKEASFELEDDYVITYSYGGGYGTYIDTVTKYIELDNDGNVLIYAYVNGEKEVKEYRVSDSRIDDLATEMVHGKFSRLNSDISNDDCLDAGSASLSIKTKNFEKSVYNYCKYNETFNDAENEFMDIVDRDKVYNFEEYIRNKYEEY